MSHLKFLIMSHTPTQNAKTVKNKYGHHFENHCKKSMDRVNSENFFIF